MANRPNRYVPATAQSPARNRTITIIFERLLPLPLALRTTIGRVARKKKKKLIDRELAWFDLCTGDATSAKSFSILARDKRAFIASSNAYDSNRSIANEHARAITRSDTFDYPCVRSERSEAELIET